MHYTAAVPIMVGRRDRPLRIALQEMQPENFKKHTPAVWQVSADQRTPRPRFSRGRIDLDLAERKSCPDRIDIDPARNDLRMAWGNSSLARNDSRKSGIDRRQG